MNKRSESAKRRYQDPRQRKLAREQMQAQLADPTKRKRLLAGAAKAAARRRGKPAGALGRADSPIYKLWAEMVQRCTNPKHRSFHNYGGRGIEVCEEWQGRGGFARFFKHVGARPSPEHTLDRIDNAGNYAPGNVRWATRKEQSHNSRKVRLVEIDGEQKPLSEWAREVGIAAPTLAYRIKNWPEERWLEPPGS